MSIINLFCRSCGHDRFHIVAIADRGDQIAQMQCNRCNCAVDINDVVSYKENYVIAQPDTDDERKINYQRYTILPGA
ncbi:hypothetical protein [Erwinia sp. SLM-02]|uniref:hypothetical protein n=1 Tax=Erwinia sp. SLM-02 TaxID=3020057 RepID=UPI003080238E